MSRPDFPTPYTPLTPSMISRIRSNQDAYDNDPDGWEQQEKQQAEERELERRQEEDYYRQQQENN